MLTHRLVVNSNLRYLTENPVRKNQRGPQKVFLAGIFNYSQEETDFKKQSPLSQARGQHTKKGRDAPFFKSTRAPAHHQIKGQQRLSLFFPEGPDPHKQA